MCRVILSPTDLFQIDSKDCQHLVRVRCQLLKLFRVKNNEILFTVVTRLYYWNALWTKIWNRWNVYVRRSLFAYWLVASDSRLMQKGLSAFCTRFKTTGSRGGSRTLHEWFAPTWLREMCSPKKIWKLVLSECNFPAFWEHPKPFRHVNSTSSERHNSVQKFILVVQWLERTI